jgi:hypothetical protein
VTQQAIQTIPLTFGESLISTRQDGTIVVYRGMPHTILGTIDVSRDITPFSQTAEMTVGALAPKVWSDPILFMVDILYQCTT